MKILSITNLYNSKNYNSLFLDELIFNYDRMEVSACASEIKGIRVLTIHKSKGLEYGSVLVVDRFKKAPPSRDTIIYEYDAVHLENIYLRMKNRDALDEQYLKALDKEKELSYEDRLNQLYVAFTRAKENLIIIQKPKDSIFEMLELQNRSYGKILRSAPKEVAKQNYTEFEFSHLYYGSQNNILDTTADEDTDLKAINFGLATHYALEMIKSFSKESIDELYTLLLNRYGFLLELEEIEDILKRVEMLISSKEFQKIVDGEIFKEQALSFNNNLRYVDLLIKYNNSWAVLDYKTSKLYADKHKAQVLCYVDAIKTITGDKVDGYICYLLKESIEIIKV